MDCSICAAYARFGIWILNVGSFCGDCDDAATGCDCDAWMNVLSMICFSIVGIWSDSWIEHVVNVSVSFLDSLTDGGHAPVDGFLLGSPFPQCNYPLSLEQGIVGSVLTLSGLTTWVPQEGCLSLPLSQFCGTCGSH